jgi:hypothetical protein
MFRLGILTAGRSIERLKSSGLPLLVMPVLSFILDR